MEAKDIVILKAIQKAYNRPDLEVEYVSDQDRVVFEAGIREVVELDKALMEHILQAADGSWSIESLRLKAFYRRRQAKLKEWGIK